MHYNNYTIPKNCVLESANILKCYFAEYQNFITKAGAGKLHLSSAAEVISCSDYHQLLRYNCSSNSDSTKVFLVVPSLFNSPEILFLNQAQSLIAQLQEIGGVYLVNWLEITNPDFSLDDYAKEITHALKLLNKRYQKPVEVIGHCIGGNLALAATISNQHLLNTLTLLTTPWDFSHFSTAAQIYQAINLHSSVKELQFIPPIYVQILFFLLELFNQYSLGANKIDYANLTPSFIVKAAKYFSLKTAQEKELFLLVENWLMSGLPLPSKAYFQIINDILLKNTQTKIQWKIGNMTICPTLFYKPVCQILAKNDKIATRSSILALHKQLKSSKLIELDGGHISYLINKELSTLITEYKAWLTVSQLGE